MPRTYATLTLDDATRMLQAGEAAAAAIGIPYNIAVVDAGGNLIGQSPPISDERLAPPDPSACAA